MIDIAYEMPDEIRRNIHEHEIWFSFNSDEGAEAFYEWMHHEGHNLFVKWVEEYINK